MKCKKCNSEFNRRAKFLAHDCFRPKEEVESDGNDSPPDDSDADSWWCAGKEDEESDTEEYDSLEEQGGTSSAGSPVSAEQKRVALQAELALVDFKLGCTSPLSNGTALAPVVSVSNNKISKKEKMVFTTNPSSTSNSKIEPTQSKPKGLASSNIESLSVAIKKEKGIKTNVKVYNNCSTAESIKDQFKASQVLSLTTTETTPINQEIFQDIRKPVLLNRSPSLSNSISEKKINITNEGNNYLPSISSPAPSYETANSTPPIEEILQEIRVPVDPNEIPFLSKSISEHNISKDIKENHCPSLATKLPCNKIVLPTQKPTFSSTSPPPLVPFANNKFNITSAEESNLQSIIPPTSDFTVDSPPTTSILASTPNVLVSNVTPLVNMSKEKLNNTNAEENNVPVINTLTTSKATQKELGKRKWDKRDFCIYCEEMVLNFSRHLTRNHSEEQEVSKILAHLKGSRERKALFEKLKRKGNFYNNVNSLRENKGTLVVVRRPTKEADPSNYLPCRLCFGYFTKNRLYRHLKECKLSKSNIESSTTVPTRNCQSFASTLLLANNNCSSVLKNKVFPKMRNDEITSAVKKDQLICSYGNQLMKTRQDNKLITVVSQKLRQLGRLILLLQAKYPQQKTLQDFIKPHMYDSIVNCVKEMSGFNEMCGSFEAPTLATKLGHSLKGCADQLECLGIRTNNSQIEENAKRFIIMMDKQWQFDISVNASRTLYRAKFNKPIALPIAHDLRLMKDFIVSKEDELFKSLKLYPIQDTWRDLLEVTLVHIIVMNRRRSGEVEKIRLSDYIDKATKEHNDDIYHSLSKVEKALCNTLTRFEIKGKRGNRVPVLLTPVMKRNLDFLISTRDIANVLPENPYLFAIPRTQESMIRGTKTIKKYALLSGAKHPENITSTKLRKHVATMSQLLHLSKSDAEQLAVFMGHNLAIHDEYYKLPENTLQVARTSQILLMFEKGSISKMDQNSLAEIKSQDLQNRQVFMTESDENESSSDEETEVICPDLPQVLSGAVPGESVEGKKHLKPTDDSRVHSAIYNDYASTTINDVGALSFGSEDSPVLVPNPLQKKRRNASENKPPKTRSTSKVLSTNQENSTNITKVLAKNGDCTDTFVNGIHSFRDDDEDNTELLASKRLPKRRKAIKKLPWSDEEREAVLRHFQKHVLLKVVPNKKDCDKCLSSEPVLAKRAWNNVKDFVRNMFLKRN